MRIDFSLATKYTVYKFSFWCNTMMLYIAEKPSLGRALADVLPRPHKKGDGFIELGNGDVVSWCIGHLLEQAPPEAYNDEYKKWRLEHLPIVPDLWQLQVKSQTKKQFSVLKKWIKQADVLVNVGDPDREGQLLVDEVLGFCKVPKAKLNAAKRCLINDLNPAAIKKSLAQLQDNKAFVPLSVSALARSRADWLYGMNMTRLCTLRGQASGYQGVLSVGRVQTPLLGLVVNREREIEAFTSQPFYEVEIELKTLEGFCFKGKWQPSKACEPYMDEEGRVLHRLLAENVVSRVLGKAGSVKRFDDKPCKQAPPLPYNLSSLQIDAAKRHGMSAKQVLDICQSLYETHKVITYPRSDCRYLPKEHWGHARQVLQAVSKVTPNMAAMVVKSNVALKTKAWSDTKVGAHHAIIPTAQSSARLSTTEQKVYELIARQYLMQFYPNFEYRKVEVLTEIEGGAFITRRKEVIDLGWKALLPKNKEQYEYSHDSMPVLKLGEVLDCVNAMVLDKQTSPPKPFTDATLLSAMTGIARFVRDPEIKKVLRETDGLGTEATRAGIIELLFNRGFLVRQGKTIRPTDIGRAFIESLPEPLVLPDMTAHWEQQLDQILHQQLGYREFIEPLSVAIESMIGQMHTAVFPGLSGKGQVFKRKKSRRQSFTKKKAPKQLVS